MKNLKCRVCYAKGEVVINLERQPLANALTNKSENQKTFPLKVFRCSDCSTLQLVGDINPKILFNNYVWVTGTSKSTINYLKNFSEMILKKYKTKKVKILEIASNDGTFLKILKKKFNLVIGVEPAKNLAKLANKNGNKTFNFFFNETNAKKIKDKTKTGFDLIICRNVIPHINNLHTVFKGINLLLNKNGKLIVEFHYAKEILHNMQFDYIYHEHTYYFTIKTLGNFAKLYGLYPNDAKKSKISGGSLILTFSKSKQKSKRFKKIFQLENKYKLNSILKVRKLNKLLEIYKLNFKRIFENNNLFPIAGYGSSARSNTLLNFVKLKKGSLNLIFDNNPLKHNKYTPGAKIKIENPSTKNINKFKTIIVFAWNFYEEIKSDLKRKGFNGTIIKTLPKIKIEKI